MLASQFIFILLREPATYRKNNVLYYIRLKPVGRSSLPVNLHYGANQTRFGVFIDFPLWK